LLSAYEMPMSTPPPQQGQRMFLRQGQTDTQ
jgi:hypothetical protein